jgi:hypothetical protein
MSTKVCYRNISNLGIIDTIYCGELPSELLPTGRWIISYKDARRPHTYLDCMAESDLYYYEDKNVYKKAQINAQEVARNYGQPPRAACCIVQ